MKPVSVPELSAVDVGYLQIRLQEAEDTLEAIRLGAVDALVVKKSDKQQIFTLRSADHTYRVLIESMNQGALTVDEAGMILYSNRQFSRMLHVPLEQIIGSSFTEWFTPEYVAELEAILFQVDKQSTDSDIQYEVECELKQTGSSVVVSATALPQLVDNACMSIVVTDITERKKAERAKDEFISLASHQLRTPATGVKQYLGMLLEGYVGVLDDRQKAYINTAYASNEKQLAIINSILKTAQIDSDVYKLRKSPQNLLALTEMVLVDFEPLFRMRQQKLVNTVPAMIELTVDPVEISIVLSNLIENASKYTANKRSIRITASQSKTMTTIKIIDHGVGIEPADQTKIFDKFTRINNAMSDTVNGSGLGLYWAKRIVTLHGGSISVQSNIGRGTTFIVSLPR